ncbi:hypothetical protein BPAE_0019g00170 [Botrytis paeoniae]|uniref:Uncharacterized protein n=1 Tax=Botrytis paeoniae TaxID=278948 RepID=A0A4Z1G4L8_9HELO|nr:hypothetical protein BPAE_0019g00170 [Botrytis paeoniae]
MPMIEKRADELSSTISYAVRAALPISSIRLASRAILAIPLKITLSHSSLMDTTMRIVPEISRSKFFLSASPSAPMSSNIHWVNGNLKHESWCAELFTSLILSASSNHRPIATFSKVVVLGIAASMPVLGVVTTISESELLPPGSTDRGMIANGSFKTTQSFGTSQSPNAIQSLSMPSWLAAAV